jgi:tetratricopeptide (TPR) repeat protein
MMSKPESDPAEESAPVEPLKEELVIRREYEPTSVAAAILYPERQVKEWRWRDPTITRQAPATGYKATSSFDDVWSRTDEICAYCAQKLAYDDNRCSRCRRNLIAKQYRYAKPSANLHIFWVLLLGLGQIYLLRAIYDVVAERNLVAAFVHVFSMGIFFGLAGGAYFRRYWAHVSAIFILGAILFVSLVTFLVPIDLTALGLEGFDPAIGSFLGSMAGGLLGFLKVFELTTAMLALFFAVFLTSPDFDRIETRQVATIERGLDTAGDYHVAAGKLAQAGLWASAVLHWQRAVAKEPHQVGYQRHLGQAYTRLGFYERSLDVLQSAYKQASQPATRAELEQLIQRVKQQSNAV